MVSFCEDEPRSLLLLDDVDWRVLPEPMIGVLLLRIGMGAEFALLDEVIEVGRWGQF